MKVEAGTQVGETQCPGCGATLPVKVNRAGGVYFFCAKVIGTNADTGKPEKCMTRSNFGRTASNRMIEQYLSTKPQEQKVNEDVKQIEDRQQPAERSGNQSVEQSGDDNPAGTTKGTKSERSRDGFFSSFFD